VKGFVVNRFRGDPKLFDSGVRFLQRRLRRPCLGVVPYLDDLGIDEEDSVALEVSRRAARWPDESGSRRRLRIAVLGLPRISNFTDFDALAAEPSVALAFVRRPAEVALADVVILPGTKQTLDDLAWLRKTGLAAAVRDQARRGHPIIGVCGGMQMLGREIRDPHGMESGGRQAGLALLPIRTALGRDKVTVRARASLTPGRRVGRRMPSCSFQGYEIHLGSTSYDAGARPLLRVRRDGSADDTEDGALNRNGSVIGTYMHGFFDDDGFRHELLRALRAAAGLSAPSALARFTSDRERRFDRLASHIRQALDVRQIESWLR
jgi:adenosylcobyric acid synthase